MNKYSGILMPVASLPAPYGIGTLGKSAYRFIDFLFESGFSVWQVLPMQPTSYGDSPYSSFSAFALNHYYIDLELLCEQGLLKKEEYAFLDWGENPRRVDYGKLYLNRVNILKTAFARVDRTDEEWQRFLVDGKYRDYAIFMALKNKFGGKACDEWGEYSEYNEEKASLFERENLEEVLFWQFTQFIFLQQWNKLKVYAHARNIKIIGDIPFYVASDSVEMWKYKRELFLLDAEGFPEAQAGVPPDAFSSTGQLWGNPVYNWEKMRQNGYAWWHRRIREGLSFYDILRIDHFIGFIRYYSIPSGEKDARRGEWKSGPGAELFKGFEGEHIVAEDLGILTDEVRAEILKTGYPGMRILQHAFDGSEENEHRPSNYPENCVAYTGTHDNETLMSRISNMSSAEYRIMCDVLKDECQKAGFEAGCDTKKAVCESILQLLFTSKADTVIIPLQDALYMDKEARINMPSVVLPDNWSFRFIENDFNSALCKRLASLNISGGRKNEGA